MDIAVYTGGALRHTKVIPYAGNVVTSDIAYAFGTPPSDAEAIKVRRGLLRWVPSLEKTRMWKYRALAVVLRVVCNVRPWQR